MKQRAQIIIIIIFFFKSKKYSKENALVDIFFKVQYCMLSSLFSNLSYPRCWGANLKCEDKLTQKGGRDLQSFSFRSHPQAIFKQKRL